MKTYATPARPSGGRFHIPRSRGAASGLLLVLLGLWGALIPFVGSYFDFAYSPDQPWVWTDGRGWLQVLPGAVAVLGGLLLMMTRNRATAMFGGWLAVAAGVWFIVGRTFASVLAIGDSGVPVASAAAKTVALELAYFLGLGALVVFLGAAALGRLSVRSVRDVDYAERRAVVADEAATHDEAVTHEAVTHDEVDSTPASRPQPVAAAPVHDRNTEVVDRPTDRRTDVVDTKQARPGIKGRLARRFGRNRNPVAH